MRRRDARVSPRCPPPARPAPMRWSSRSAPPRSEQTQCRQFRSQRARPRKHYAVKTQLPSRFDVFCDVVDKYRATRIDAAAVEQDLVDTRVGLERLDRAG